MNLNNILKEKCMTVKRLSETTGIKYGTLLKYSSGERKVSVKAAIKIGKALDVAWWELIDTDRF